MTCIEGYHCWVVTKYVSEIGSRVLDGCCVKLLHEYFEGCCGLTRMEKERNVEYSSGNNEVFVLRHTREVWGEYMIGRLLDCIFCGS